MTWDDRRSCFGRIDVDRRRCVDPTARLDDNELLSNADVLWPNSKPRQRPEIKE